MNKENVNINDNINQNDSYMTEEENSDTIEKEQ